MAVEHNNHSAQESNILAVPESTEAFHAYHDSRFLAGYAPLFYSLKGEEKLSSYTLPVIAPGLVIPFGFEKNNGNSFRIELAKEIPGITLLLVDLKTDTEHTLTKDGPYAFESAVGDNPLRFELHFGKSDDPTGIRDAGDDLAGALWYHDNRLYVESADEATEVFVYDINGRRLRTFRPGAGKQSYALQLPAGVYIVRMTEPGGMQSLRIAVQ